MAVEHPILGLWAHCIPLHSVTIRISFKLKKKKVHPFWHTLYPKDIFKLFCLKDVPVLLFHSAHQL